MIRILDFAPEHAREAERIALCAYQDARENHPALPAIDAVPDLSAMAETGLGAAAFESGRMVGFLCGTSPFANAFGSTDAVGVFSPMGANGVMGPDRGRVFAALYERAAERWARAGASSHAICVYAHDREAQAQFFRYGFGMRCVDAIRDLNRPMEALGGAERKKTDGAEREKPATLPDDIALAELPPQEAEQVLPLQHRLDAHMAASPCFILRPSDAREAFLADVRESGARLFAARRGGEILAFLRVQRGGETFICDQTNSLHITGAYSLPEYRGQGIVRGLLRFVMATLREEGIARLGVDYESLNPEAWHFWGKNFTAYTYGLVRRIDERAVGALRRREP